MNKNIKNTIIGSLCTASIGMAGWWINGVNATQSDVTAIKAIAPLMAENTKEIKADVNKLKEDVGKLVLGQRRIEDKLGIESK